MVAPHLSNRKKGSKSDKNLGIILKIFSRKFVGDVGHEAIDGRPGPLETELVGLLHGADAEWKRSAGWSALPPLRG
jgi:hypothetical protein